MGKIWPNIHKELLLLFRDYMGLLVIFLMPVALVIVVTLVQQNLLKSMGETKTKALFLDKDRQTVGPKLEEVLKKANILELFKELKGKTIDVETAKKLLRKAVTNSPSLFLKVRRRPLYIMQSRQHETPSPPVAQKNIARENNSHRARSYCLL